MAKAEIKVKAQKPTPADVERWIVAMGGISGREKGYDVDRVDRIARQAGQRVFDKVVKGQIKLTDGA